MTVPMTITAFDLAVRFIGVKEIFGSQSHPLVQWWLSLCSYSLHSSDEIPWCSAFVNGIAWELRLPRSKSAAARSWLTVGTPIVLADAKPAFDIVVIKRGKAPQPGPEVTSGAPGHVAFYAGIEANRVLLLGGNQGDTVSIQQFAIADILGVRRLYT